MGQVRHGFFLFTFRGQIAPPPPTPPCSDGIKDLMALHAGDFLDSCTSRLRLPRWLCSRLLAMFLVPSACWEEGGKLVLFQILKTLLRSWWVRWWTLFPTVQSCFLEPNLAYIPADKSGAFGDVSLSCLPGTENPSFTFILVSNPYSGISRVFLETVFGLLFVAFLNFLPPRLSNHTVWDSHC